MPKQDTLKRKKFPIIIILEDIRSAFNVGAIFRTADAAGIKKIFLTGITPYPPHNRIPKTALGATETVSWEYSKSIAPVLKDLKEKGVTIVAAELTQNAQVYTNYNFAECGTVAIVFGHEINGVAKNTLSKCDAIVKIPMFGQKESLNVEVSCGVIIYEIVRQLTTTKA